MILRPVAVVGGLYTVSERGLAADVLAARARGLAPMPICTSIVVASGGVVTDVTDVPVDTVHAQLDHLSGAGPVQGVKIGILGGPKTAAAVLDHFEGTSVPVVLDLVASGPSGETVLSARGIDAIAERLAVPDLVTLSRADAELVTGGQIESLDDAQVAAQRLHHRGARRVVVRCGTLPYRFYDAAEDPGSQGDGAAPAPFHSDLYYDGEDFALYESAASDVDVDGLSSVYAITVLGSLIDGDEYEAALQAAKKEATDAIRTAYEVAGHPQRFNPTARSGA